MNKHVYSISFNQLFSRGIRFAFNGEFYIESLGNVQVTMDDTSHFSFARGQNMAICCYGMVLKGWSGYWWLTILGILQVVPFSKNVPRIFSSVGREFLLKCRLSFQLSTLVVLLKIFSLIPVFPSITRFKWLSKRILFPLEQQNTWRLQVILPGHCDILR